MIKLIKSQLKQWLRAEWIQITTKLNDLIEYSYEELNFIPSFSLSNSFRPPNEQLNQQEILQDSFVSAQNNSSYSQISIDELIELEQSAFEGIPQIFEEGSSFAISLISGSPSAIIQGGKLLHSLTQLVGKVLSYRDIKKNELQEVISQLKDQNSEYYQRLADFLADKLLNNMMTALDDEKRNFRLSLDDIEDQFETYFRQLKNYDQQYKQKQKFLQKEMLDFEQIKSLIKL